MPQLFRLADSNSNPTRGCLCHPQGRPVAAGGDYAVFHQAELIDFGGRVPHLCIGCAEAAVEQHRARRAKIQGIADEAAAVARVPAVRRRKSAG